MLEQAARISPGAFGLLAHLVRRSVGPTRRRQVRRSCSPRRPMTLAPKRSDSPLGLGGAMADAMQRVLPQTLATGGARADGVVGWRSPGGGTAGPLLDACVQMGSASTTDEPASGSRPPSSIVAGGA